jgi:hypothetical protein
MRERGEIDAREFRLVKQILLEELAKSGAHADPVTQPIAGKADTIARKFLKWTGIAISGVFVVFLIVGLSGLPDMTPEERAAIEARRAGAARTKAILDDPDTVRKYGRGEIVSRTDYGVKWPYPSTDSAVLRCRMMDFGLGTTPRPFVTIQANGRIYGVNGVAIGKMKMPDSKEIMARGEYGEVVLGATHDLIQRAIRSCR